MAPPASLDQAQPVAAVEHELKKVPAPAPSTLRQVSLHLQTPPADGAERPRPTPLGFLRLPAEELSKMTLAQLRTQLLRQLNLPADLAQGSFQFLLGDGLPVSTKQEGAMLLTEELPDCTVHVRPLPAPQAGRPRPPPPAARQGKRARWGDFEEEQDQDQDQDQDQEASGSEDTGQEGEAGAGEAPLFRVVSEPVVSCQTGRVLGHERKLMFCTGGDPAGPQLCDQLGKLMQMPDFYEKQPKVRVSSFLMQMDRLRNAAKTGAPALVRLVQELEKELGETLQKIAKMREDGHIPFEYLWALFPKDAQFTAELQGEPVGSVVLETRYQQSFFGNSFQVSGSLIKSNGVGLTTFNKWFSIDEFEGMVALDKLPLRPLTEERRALLTARGRVYRDLSIGAHYLQYQGSMSYQQWCMVQKFKADGRIMVDPVSFNRFNPSYRTFRFGTEEEGRGTDTIPDEKLFMTWPTVPGFSFASKKWGEFCVGSITPVRFDDQAFDSLVLDPEKKRLIRCLVQNSSRSFADIISGKGGGVIFLLHGPPGVGKTLTAEAVSELLHRPLYTVNIGELGVTTKQLEDKLSQILEVASTWNAIILLDEADIFLERRTDQDIERNALVGIFLRLLEYHQGVLFLTTNRVKSFDEAFHSRISIALHYQNLDRPARRQIWRNLLAAARIDAGDELDPEALSEFELNGRQIKNTIRLAQTIALEEGKPVSREDVAKCVQVARQFQADLDK